MPRRKETEADIRARATDYLARILFAKEHDIHTTRDEEIAAWLELNEQEQERYRNIAAATLAEMEREYQERSAAWKAERQSKQV
jgi:hypothetical protein